MLYIYGDSHAKFLFSRIQIPGVVNSTAGITMHRIGRDNLIISWDDTHHNHDTMLCFVYGEIDCRHHIKRQIDKGRDEDEVIHTLVNAYIETIRNNIREYRQVYIIGVVPTTSQADFDYIHGTNHGFLFSGTESERVRYTQKINDALYALCVKYGYIFVAPYDFYTDVNGCLIRKYSDGGVHIRNNAHFLDYFMRTRR